MVLDIVGDILSKSRAIPTLVALMGGRLLSWPACLPSSTHTSAYHLADPGQMDPEARPFFLFVPHHLDHRGHRHPCFWHPL